MVSEHCRKLDVAVVGGGPAGYFGAIACAEKAPGCSITIFEASSSPLAKLLRSGGGRCNLTFDSTNPRELAESYPRGGKELISPLTRFGPHHVIEWFSKRGVELKTEPDRRIFPASDRAETVANCLETRAAELGVEVQLGARVDAVSYVLGGSGARTFSLLLKDGGEFSSQALLLCTGGSRKGQQLAASLGHGLQEPVPALFAFAIKDPRLEELSGITMEHVSLRLTVGDNIYKASGPLVITHTGVGGPAVLRLSSLAARDLSLHDYQGELQVDWTRGQNVQELVQSGSSYRNDHVRQQIGGHSPYSLPGRLWQNLLRSLDISPMLTWQDVSKKMLGQIARELTQCQVKVTGRATSKDEFVTCGGVSLSEIDFQTMESKLCPNLYLSGEILDVDGFTGGFNLQNCWTTAKLAGDALAERINQLRLSTAFWH